MHTEEHRAGHTEGNGASSSLVEQLEGYYEEGIWCTQHWLECKKLLEWDEPAIVCR